MSILKRMKTMFKAQVNDTLDKVEDPIMLIDQNLRELQDALHKITGETASVVAEVERYKKEVENCEAEVAKYDKATRNALVSGDDEAAKKLLAEKKLEEKKLATLKTQLDVVSKCAENLKQARIDYNLKLKALKNKRDELKATAATTEVIKKMNDLDSALNGDLIGDSLIGRMEEKVLREFNEANALKDLNGTEDEVKDILEKYTCSTMGSSLDEELAQMRLELEK